MTQKVFVLDLDRCTGCAACVVACTNENGVSPALSWRTIHTFNRRRLPQAPVFHYSLACNHCGDPACLTGCPAAAYAKDRNTGAVLINQDLCIGCRYCAWVCPYEAPRFDSVAGVMEKCTFCSHRLDELLSPACVVACPTDALQVETDNDLPPVDRPGFPETGLRPSVRIVGNRRSDPPRMTTTVTATGRTERRQRLDWNGLSSEWPLWLFTWIAVLLVGWFTAATAGGPPVKMPLFVAAGIGAMAVSALHLGKKSRIWRATLNFKTSWISREIVLFLAFFGAAIFLTADSRDVTVSSWIVAATGFATLFAMDMVYRVPGQPVITVPHSAMTTVTGAFYVGLLSNIPALAVPAAMVKLILYLLQRGHQLPGGVTLSLARLIIGLGLPCVLMAIDRTPLLLTIAAAASGELIDRAQFYANLRFLTPSLQIKLDLTRQE